MQLTHKIALCLTPEQTDYFRRACGTTRRVWNWALDAWNKQYAAGVKSNATALKKQFNAIKYSDPQWLGENGQPWLQEIHRDAHAQPSAHIRVDFTHKLTTRICRENQAVVIENLHVKGMLANDKLTRAISSDVGFGMFRAQIEYKAKRYGTHLVIADRWVPSGRLCSVCDWKHEALTLNDRAWTCPEWGTHHDRDYNASLNLKRLATAFGPTRGKSVQQWRRCVRDCL